MKLSRLIDEGKGFTKDIENTPYNPNTKREKGEKWIRKSTDFLKSNYGDSKLTSNFIEVSGKVEKDYSKMVSILRGLKDVEEEIGMLGK